MISNLFWGNLNSSLGAPFALGENFGEQQTPSLVLSPKFSPNTKFPPQILELDSNKSTVSSLRENERSEFSWQSKQNKCASAQPNLARFVLQKIGIKDAVVPSADFLLESELRGSPPKSEKRQLLARRGSGAGGAALLRKEKGESQSKKIVGDLRIAKIDSSLTAFAQNDESFVDCHDSLRDSRNDDIFLDSSRCRAQNDGMSVDCHDSATPNLAMTQLLRRI